MKLYPRPFTTSTVGKYAVPKSTKKQRDLSKESARARRVKVTLPDLPISKLNSDAKNK